VNYVIWSYGDTLRLCSRGSESTGGTLRFTGGTLRFTDGTLRLTGGKSFLTDGKSFSPTVNLF
jgi:hypothetical protein